MSDPIHVLHLLPNLALGGGQVLVLRTIQGLDPEGFRSSVCSVWRDGPSSMSEQFRAAGVPVLSLEFRRSLAPAALWRLVRFLRRERVDLIHTNNTYWDRRFGALASALTGVPLVNTFHSMAFPAQRPSLERLDEALLRGRVRQGVAVSGAVHAAWATYMDRIELAHDDVHVVHPGLELGARPVELSSGDEAALRRDLDLEGAGPLLVNVARLTRGKGQLELLAAMSEVRARWPGAKLLLVGDGPERPAIEAAVRAEGLEGSVRLLGRRDDVPQLLALADLFWFASEGEGLGLAVLEAMAAKKPVVAYDLPALRELMEDEVSGRFVPQGDPRALAARTLELLEAPARLRSMGQRARATVEARFTHARSVAALEAVYRDALTKAPTPSPLRADAV